MDPTRWPHVRQEPSMERRTFMALVSGGLLAAPLAAEGQLAGRVYQIAFFRPVPSLPARTCGIHSGKDFGRWATWRVKTSLL
jgi:hypothetical protein